MSDGLDALDAITNVILAYRPDSKRIESKPLAENAQVIQGDCAAELCRLPKNSIDLFVTSPPYADQRKHTYGGITPDGYVAWFLPIADEVYRALKPTGSFVLNITERVVDGERTPTS